MNISILGSGFMGRAIRNLCQDAGLNCFLGERSNLAEAAAQGEVVFLALPFAACKQVLPTLQLPLQAKIVVDITNPVQADGSPLLLGDQDSAGE